MTSEFKASMRPAVGSTEDEIGPSDLALADAMEEYLKLFESDEPFDCDSFFAKHASIADRLRPAVESLDFLNSMAPARLASLVDRQPTSETEVTSVGNLGDFRIIRELGRGGMGVVYEADQKSLARRVALKVLPFAGLLDQRQLLRFRNEARAAATLKHQNIVSVFGIGNEGSIHFYAMELIDGHDLATVIREVHESPAGEGTAEGAETQPTAQLSTERSGQRDEFYRSVARLGVQAANALHFAHQQGVIHRDIKPANLLLDSDRNLHITDFGLARLPTTEDLTLTGDQPGTLRYMSPEQLDGNRVADGRTDVYSLGLTLYELIAGRAAFVEESRQELATSILEKDPEPLHRLDANVPRDLRTIIEKSIAKEPEDRFQNASELAEDLDRFLEYRTIKARPTTSLARAGRFARRNPLLTTLLASTMLLLAVVAAGASAVAWKFSADAAIESERLREREQELRGRELELYARDTQLAKSAMEEANWREGERLLLKWVPDEGITDHRGLEWYYLWNLCHPTDIERSYANFGWVYEMAFSPDGKRLAQVAQFSQSVSIWDLNRPIDAGPVARLRCKSSGAFALKSVGETLIAGDRTGNVYLWDWQTLKPLVPPIRVEHGELAAMTRSIDLSPDHRYLAVGAQFPGDTHVIKIYDLQSDSWVFEQPDQQGVSRVAFDHEGHLLAATAEDDRVRVLEVPSGKLARSLTLDGKVVTAELSKDRTMLAIGLEQRLGSHRDAWVEVRHLHDESDFFRLHLSDVQIRGLSFAGDNAHLAIGTGDGRLRLVDLVQRQVYERKMHSGSLNSVRFAPGDSRLATAGNDRLVHILRLDAARRHHAPLVRSKVGGLKASFGAAFLDSQTVCVSRDERLIDVWNAQTGELIETKSVGPGFGNFIRIDAHQGRRLFAAGQMQWPIDKEEIVPGRITLWSRDAKEPIDVIDIPHGLLPISMPFSPDGRYLAACGRKWVTIIDTAQRSKRTKKFSNWVKTCAFAPDGKTLACAEIDGQTHFLSIETLEPVREPFVTDSVLPDCMHYIPGTDNLAVVGLEKRLKIWDVTTGHLVRQSQPYQTFLATVRVSPDGTRIGVGAIDGKFRIFRTEDCEELISFDVPTTYAYCDFSPDGKSLVVTAEKDAFVVHGRDHDELKHLSIAELLDMACKNLNSSEADL